ncbi:hypothetical protein [Curtanaerobium respiraculi]|uniref:hypothetical protein n=1 Tax=Curtanaerobium respiraculi TaxID=2949669 RepID=UPI0024B33EF1|nr:hypothetical protein [Curtanaerobium respiraculi]
MGLHIWGRVGLFVGGMAATCVLKAASKSEGVRDTAVKGVAGVLKANDRVQEYTQSVMDDAEDLRAEGARERRIQAGVEERLAAMEDDIRAEVTAEVDGVAKDAKAE